MITMRSQTHSITGRGFTLLEILVALAILTISMSALIKAASDNRSNFSHLRNKTFASIIAANKAEELYVGKAWPGVGSSTGAAELANHQWQWKIEVSNTEDPGVRRAQIYIYLDKIEGNPLYTLTTYLGKP